MIDVDDEFARKIYRQVRGRVLDFLNLNFLLLISFFYLM
jgi:hypothetical protein